jgi:hypothetical protein
MRLTRFLHLIYLALGLVGCATKVAGLKQSPTFTFDNIARGKISVGGVALTTAPLSEGHRASLGGILRTALLEERKEFTVLPVGTAASRLGSEYPKVLRELQEAGSLSEASLGLLRRKIRDSRYIAFARVENDEVSKDRHETASSDKEGKPIPGSERVIANAQRSVTASLLVYDLTNGEMAWSGTVTKSLTGSRQYDKEREIGLVSVIKAIKGDSNTQSPEEKYPFPEAPDSKQVLAKVFAGFAENFPEKD